MKNFRDYLVESQQTHSYRIKIVGDVPADFVRQFQDQLKKFDPERMGDVKKTPIMAQHPDFPNYPNQQVTMMDVTFRYPATMPQIQQMARLLGLEEDRICMQQKDYAEGMDQEALGIEQQKDLLVTDYPADTKEQKDIKKDYAAVGGDKAVVKNSAAEAAWTVAGGKTPAAETTNDLAMGVTSPMTRIKRPPRPETGFRT